MNIELGKATVIFFVLVTMTSQTMLHAGGNRERSTETIPVEETRRILLRTEPSQRPDWVDTIPQSDTEFYWVGTSQPFATAANARNNARENARNKALSFTGEFMQRQAVESGSISGSTGETLGSFVVREEEIISHAENIISQMGTRRYFTEVFLNSNNQVEYIVYVLSRICRQRMEESIENFASNISRRYTAMIMPQATLRSTLESHVAVIRALRQNPLHRAIAYHESPTGRAGLYGHVQSVINDLVNSIDMVTIPSQIVQTPNMLNVMVQFNSSKIDVIGPFDVRVSIHGMNIAPPQAHYTITADNSFLLQIRTQSLKPGLYTAQIELLLHEITGTIRRNISGSFVFEVKPLIPVQRSNSVALMGLERMHNRIGSQTVNTRGIFSTELTRLVQRHSPRIIEFFPLPPGANELSGAGTILEFARSGNMTLNHCLIIIFYVDSSIEPGMSQFGVPPHLFASGTVLVYDAALGKIIFSENMRRGTPLFDRQNIAGSADALLLRLLPTHVPGEISLSIEAGIEARVGF